MMDTTEKRKKLVEYIENSDEQAIDNLFWIIENKKTPDEEFLRNYNKEIDEAMERIDKGFYMTHENVEKEAESW